MSEFTEAIERALNQRYAPRERCLICGRMKQLCGTTAGYSHHYNWCEPRCQPCKDAKAKQMRDRKHPS